MKIWRCFLFQTFGEEPTEEQMRPIVDVIWPNFSKGKKRKDRISCAATEQVNDEVINFMRGFE